MGYRSAVCSFAGGRKSKKIYLLATLTLLAGIMFMADVRTARAQFDIPGLIFQGTRGIYGNPGYRGRGGYSRRGYSRRGYSRRGYAQRSGRRAGRHAGPSAAPKRSGGGGGGGGGLIGTKD